MLNFEWIFSGFLQTADGLVLKPVQSPPRGEREHNFFKRIFKSNHSDLNEDEQELKNLLPHYRGSFVHNESE
jgi:1D-myo-inositol-tetrakisphosphate 5-kinase/inositol-polyphosphate multikinase